MARESGSERNKKYIRGELLREIDAGTKYIETTLLKRYWYVGPVMRVIYRTQMPQARRRLVNAADVILEYSDQLLNRDAYEKYLQQNEAWIRRKTGHKKEGELRKTIESTFELRVDWAKKLVQAEGNSYDDLVRNTMTRVEARKVAEEQIDMEKKIVVDLGINQGAVEIPLKWALGPILNEGLDYAKGRLLKRVDEIFS